MFEWRVHKAVAECVAATPNLLSSITVEKFTDERRHEVHSQELVAELIASVLPDGLKVRGYQIVELPAVERDQYGTYSVRVPIIGQPWADGEIRIRHTPNGAQASIFGVLSPFSVDDLPAIAVALLAVHEFCKSYKPG